MGGGNMAVKRTGGDAREALIQRAAAEIRKLNPRIGQPQQPMPEDEYARLMQEAHELERIWDQVDEQSAGKPKYSASDAVVEDRDNE